MLPAFKLCPEGGAGYLEPPSAQPILYMYKELDEVRLVWCRRRARMGTETAEYILWSPEPPLPTRR